MAWPPPPGGTWLLDLDGVVWLSGQPIDGVDRAVKALRSEGVRPLFATNNAGLTVDQVLERLAGCGIDAERHDVVNSPQAAASLLEPGSTVLAVCGAGALEALAARGVKLVERGPADAVVVGYTTAFDYDLLARAAAALHAGARLIGTNDDATYPTPDGLLPGAGSLLAAVTTAGGVQPVVAGKPHEPMAQLVRQRAGDVVTMVGDRPSTDGLFARRLGVPFALVLTGVTKPGAPAGQPEADVTSASLATLVDSVLGR